MPMPEQEALACPGHLSSLLKRCAEGDPSALGELYDVVGPLVLGTVGRDLPRRLAHHRLRRVFADLWRNAASYDPELQGPVTWVLAIAAARART